MWMRAPIYTYILWNFVLQSLFLHRAVYNLEMQCTYRYLQPSILTSCSTIPFHLINLSPLNSAQSAEISTHRTRFHRLNLPDSEAVTLLLPSTGVLCPSSLRVDETKLFWPKGTYFYSLLEYFVKELLSSYCVVGTVEWYISGKNKQCSQTFWGCSWEKKAMTKQKNNMKVMIWQSSMHTHVYSCMTHNS